MTSPIAAKVITKVLGGIRGVQTRLGFAWYGGQVSMCVCVCICVARERVRAGSARHKLRFMVAASSTLCLVQIQPW